MATIKPVSFNRLPEIDENDGKVILHDGSQLGRSTKELGEIIDDRLRTGLEDGKQYAMTTSGWKDVVIPEVDLTPYAYSAGLEADKQFVMTDNGWAEVDLSPYALSADVDSKVEEISAWANETFLTGVDLSDYALSADVDTRIDEVLEDYYKKIETSGKNEISAALEIKQDLIQNKKDSSIPYLETSSSNPSWEVIESEQINAHGTAEEGKTYTIAINDRPYKTVCIGGKLWLAENYIDDSHALYTDEDYGSYFMANTISRYIPQGWHLPSKEEWELLQNAHSDELEKLFSTDWHTDPNRPDYIQCTNELKLNLTPGGYYNRNTSEVLQKGYNSYYATSTYEVLSQSSQQQRVYVKLKNCVEHKSQMISFDWDGPRKADSSYPSNIRLIKDDLDVSGPDCWKTFKGKNFMAIADNEGNTFKDFYLKKAEAQATYQPIGTYASSAGVETLNTYYALTTTGWKDIAEGFYDKTSIDNSLGLKQDNLTFAGENNTITAINNSAMGGSFTGEYVPLSAMQCTIGINNTNTNQGVSFTQGFSNTVQNDNAFAQGTSNTVSQQSMAQGIANSAYNNSFAQGGGAYANTFSFAQGNGISANNTAMVQGKNSYSDTDSLAVGENVSAISYSLAVGKGNTAFQGSIAVGLNNISKENGFTQGYGNSALGAYSVAIGLENSANSYYTFTTGRENSAAGEDAIAMGQRNYAARRYTFAVGLGNSAINGHAIALGQNNIVNGEFGVALSQLNSAFGDNTFVVGYKSYAKGRYADAIGFQNSAIGEYSFVAGCTSKAYTNAISIGTYNDASGTNSVAIGHGVSAKQDDQTVLGKYNEISNDASDLLIVGNGSDSSHTSNAFVIKSTGIASATNMMTTAGYVVVSADVTATDTQYAMTTSGWQPTVNLVPGTGIVFRNGTGADEGKTFVDVDSTNYKLLTTAEYNSLTAVIDTVSTYSARWVLTNN